jgi:hypothetical protein
MKNHQFPPYSFYGFFLTLIALLLLPAFFGNNFGLTHKLLWSTSLLACLWLITHDHRKLFLGSVLAIPCLVINWELFPGSGEWIPLAYHFFTILFLVFITIHLPRFVIVNKKVNSDLIFASLCAYLLLALVWSRIYILIELFFPGSFSIGVNLNQSSEELSALFTYYSFVTISTLGYGDIAPMTQLARSWATMEAIFGQLYLAIVVARLMGLYIGSELTKNNKGD